MHSAYYQVATEYYKESGPPESYYKHALMLLAYTPMEKMTKDAAVALATDMTLAALSGEGLYNFGEVEIHHTHFACIYHNYSFSFTMLWDLKVLATPLVSALEGTPNAWLGEMLRIFNRGDIEAFSALFAANQVCLITPQYIN